MHGWMPKKLGKLVCSFAVLQFCSCSLVGQHYIQSLMFGAMPTSDKKENGNLTETQADDSTLFPKSHLSNVQTLTLSATSYISSSAQELRDAGETLISQDYLPAVHQRNQDKIEGLKKMVAEKILQRGRSP